MPATLEPRIYITHELPDTDTLSSALYLPSGRLLDLPARS